MKINYNVTGADRKKLVSAISQEFNAPTKYLGMPTAAYEVGGYHIDKSGVLTGEDNHDLVADLQALHDFKAVSEEYDGCESGTADNPIYLGSDTFRYHGNPSAPITEAMLRQIEEAPIPPFEDLQMTEAEELGLGTERRDPIGEDGMQASDVPEPDTLVIEMPIDGFTPDKLDNLTKLVAAKENLIKAALGVGDLPIQVLEDRICFPWFEGELDRDSIFAYTTFISLLCKTAKEQKRVTASERAVENKKYAFRCLLLRIGMIGAEYKATRHILLKNLKGNGAFKAKPETAEVNTEAVAYYE